MDIIVKRLTLILACAPENSRDEVVVQNLVSGQVPLHWHFVHQENSRFVTLEPAEVVQLSEGDDVGFGPDNHHPGAGDDRPVTKLQSHRPERRDEPRRPLQGTIGRR